MGMRLDVYDRANPTKRIATIPFKTKPRFLEELNGVGGGSFDIKSSDTHISYLQERNIVKVVVNRKVVSAFFITSVKPKMIDSGEFSTEVTTVTGKGLNQWPADAVVQPHGGLRAASGDERSFNFASPKGSWLNLNNWGKPYEVAKYNSKNNPWKTAPAEWPDFPNAQWLWWSNTFGGQAIADLPLTGFAYFRRDFTTTAAGKYSFFCAADDIYEVYVDGQLLANASPGRENWTKTQRVDFELPAGDHVVGVKVQNVTGPGGLLGALALVGDAKNNKIAKTISVTNASNWKMSHFPTGGLIGMEPVLKEPGTPAPVNPGSDPVTTPGNPGWTPGEVMNQLLAEAKARGVWWAKYVKPSYTATKDSQGKAWSRELDFSFQVGESYLSVMDKMRELVCDIWIDPDDYSLHMALSRGVDRADVTKPTGVIQLRKGKDLLGADQTTEANVKNALVVDSSSGKFYLKDPVSVAKYGVVEDSLSISADSRVSRQIAAKVLEQSRNFSVGATYNIFPSSGMVPFEDFNIGDWVLAPGNDGPKTRRRVSSISITENSDTGEVEYDIELDTIYESRQRHLDRWMTNVLSGSMGGTVMATQFKLPRVLTASSGGSVFIEEPTVVMKATQAPTVGYYAASGAALASATLSWDLQQAVGDEYGDEAENTLDDYDFKYDIYSVSEADDDNSVILLASTTDRTITISDLPAETDVRFKIVAKSQGGIEVESDVLTLSMPAPAQEDLPIPSLPTAGTSMGSITVEWDGTFENGQALPPQVAYVRVAASEVPGGVYLANGPTIPKEGGTTTYVGLTQGQDWYVVLIAVDQNGKESAPSASRLVSIKGIGSLDIELASLNKDLLDAGLVSELGDLDAATRKSSILVNNYSFEVDTGWEGLDSGSGIVPFRRIEVDDAQEGNWVLQADSAYPLVTDPIAVAAASGIQRIHLTEGREVSASVFAKVSSAAPGTFYGGLTIYELAEGQTNSLVGATVITSVEFGSTKLTEANTWKEFTTPPTKVPAPVTGNYALVVVAQTYQLPHNTLELDNVSLYSTTLTRSLNGNIYSPDPASGEGDGVDSTWFQQDSSYNVIAMWRWDGTTWQPLEVTSEVIANLDAGKITTGYLEADRILVGSLGGDKLTFNAIDGKVINGAELIGGKITGGEYSLGNIVSDTVLVDDNCSTVSNFGTYSFIPLPPPTVDTSKFVSSPASAKTANQHFVKLPPHSLGTAGYQYTIEMWINPAGTTGQAYEFAPNLAEDHLTGDPQKVLRSAKFTALANVWTKKTFTFYSEDLTARYREFALSGNVVNIDDVKITITRTGASGLYIRRSPEGYANLRVTDDLGFEAIYSSQGLAYFWGDSTGDKITGINYAGVYSVNSANSSPAPFAVDGILSNNGVTGGLAPTGSMLEFAGSAAPGGYLLCNGAAVSRTTYATLYSVIGITYGAGNGTTTFNVPDRRGRVGVGLSTDTEFNALGKTFGTKTHLLTTGQIPELSGTAASNGNHTHTVAGSQRFVTTDRSTDPGHRAAPATTTGDYVPAWAAAQNVSSEANTTSNGAHTHTVTVNSGTTTAHNNIQPSIALNYIIKT